MVKMSDSSDWQPLATKVDQDLAKGLHKVIWNNLNNNALGCEDNKKKCDNMKRILKAKKKLLSKEYSPLCLPSSAQIKFEYAQ